MRTQFDHTRGLRLRIRAFPIPTTCARPAELGIVVVGVRHHERGAVKRDQPPLLIPRTLRIRTRDRLYHVADDRLYGIGT